MSRPSTITDSQILGAARAVFLERGFLGTTAEVARRAGVAEGSIFKRFATKQALFTAAMDPGDEDHPWMVKLAEHLGKGDLRAHLTEAGLSLVGFFRQMMPMWMMGWSARASSLGPSADPKTIEECIPLHLRGNNSRPIRAIRRFAAHLEGEMRLGRMRRQDPETIARAFAGAVQNFVFSEMVLRTTDTLPLPAETFVRNLVSLLWGGLAPLKGKRALDSATRRTRATRATASKRARKTGKK